MDIRSIRNRTIITTSIMTKIVSKITNHGGGGGGGRTLLQRY